MLSVHHFTAYTPPENKEDCFVISTAHTDKAWAESEPHTYARQRQIQRRTHTYALLDLDTFFLMRERRPNATRVTFLLVGDFDSHS
jgi:hypothetical protein